MLRQALLMVSMLLSSCGTDAGATAEARSANATPVLLAPADAVEEFRQLEAGAHVVGDPFPVRISFVVPDGWLTWAYTPAASQVNIVKPAVGEVSFEIVDNVSAEPCTQLLRDPPVGASVEDLVAALSDISDVDVSPPTHVTIDGFPGTQLTITAPAETRCERLYTWRTTTRQNGVGPGEVNEIRILDVDGIRLVIAVAHGPALAVDARSEIDSVLDSIQIGD